MKLNKRVEASTLAITVVVAFILSILCFSIILLAYYNKRSYLKYKIDNILSRNIQSATNLVLSDISFHNIEKKDTIDLFGRQADSIVIHTEGWGIFQRATVSAKYFNRTKSNSFIYGSSLPVYMESCLYLADHKSPLFLSGKSKLVGNAYLPKSGARITYINQRGFDNKELVYGKISDSKEMLPELKQEFLLYTNRMLESFNQHSTKPIEKLGSHIQSFYDTCFNFYATGKLLLDKVNLEGHINIFCDSIIEVTNSAQLNNIILIAPYVKIGTGFSGCIQAIASDSIIVEPACLFRYPSALALIKSKKNESGAIVRIGEQSIFNGVLISYAEGSDPIKPRLYIEEMAKVNGIVYANGYTELKCTINGVLLTDFILYKSSGNIFENHLVDVEINRSQLTPYFIGSSVFSETKVNKIVKWVN